MFARLHTYRQLPLREDELLGWSRDEVAGLPGFFGAVVPPTENGDAAALTLWGARAKMRVLHLAESREAIAGVTRAVTTTPLLPGEDPALLPGPDRVRPYRVLAYRGARV